MHILTDDTALVNCHAQRLEANLDAAHRVVARFDNQCMALAKDTGKGGTAWRWAVAEAQPGADAVAMANCRNFAGGRAGYCEMTMRHCDGD